MKKTLFILMAMFALCTTQSHAQNILDLLKGLSSKQTESQPDSTKSTNNTLSELGDFVAGLLGQGKINGYNLIGTWSYTEPAVVFESENMLTNVGGVAAGKAAQKKLQTYLDKIGFTAGKVKITFKEDSTGTVTYGTKDIPFKWSIQDSDLTINLAGNSLSKYTSSLNLSKFTSFKMNCKLGIGSMQLSFKADKLLDFISKILSIAGNSSNNSTINTIVSLANNVDGMYLGLTLEK
ncbi:MAG: DUF4923 family protein [Bacteroidaceae bacterium]|nr:DUF4923 family protein [Bacteroidaceae bacterium]